MKRDQLTVPRFTQADVLKATGLSAQTLQNYVTREVFEVYSASAVQGHRRLYSAADVVLLACMSAVSGFSIPPRTAGSFANHVRAWMLADAPRDGTTEKPPKRFFLFCPEELDEVKNLPDIMLSGPNPAKLLELAVSEGHTAFLILDGGRIIAEALARLPNGPSE
jgi:hypothetical protein